MKVPVIATHPPTAAATTTTATTAATKTIKTTTTTASSTTSPPSSSTERLKRKKSGGALVAMATERPSGMRPPQNPTTPVLPRLRAAPRTPLTTTTSSNNNTPSASLHPNVTTRSPKSLARKARAESIASTNSPYHHHQLSPRPHVARPSSAASNRSFASTAQNGTPSRRPQTTAAAAATASAAPMFFHASDVGSPVAAGAGAAAAAAAAAAVSAAVASPSPSGPKFFHADGAPSVMDGNDDVAPPPLRGSTASSNGPPTLAPSPSSIRTPTHSLPSSRPASVVGFPASSRSIPSSSTGSARSAAAPANRTHVKFVYANGTEEVLPPRDQSEIGSATTSPQLLSSPFAGPSNPRSHSPSHSPTRVAYPLSPIVPPLGAPSSPPPSYFQRHAAGSSRRSSVDAKPRHSRGLSIGSVVDLPIAIPTNRETDDADDEAHHGSGDNGSGRGGRRGRRGSSSDEEAEGNGDDDEPEEAHPPPMTAAERIKLMEERSAASRRERKVMDLEISNASLLAINKTLERELRKQSAELRRYKRLARSGRLPVAPPAADRPSPNLLARSADATSDWEVDGVPDGDGDGDDTETEKLSDDDGDGDDDDDDDDDDGDDDDESGASDEKHRAADEKRLTVDLAKHQALLDASTKMNKSLRCSLLVTDQLIREGKKALEYQVRPSDVRLGGRILCDEEDYYESPMESAGISAAEETDAEPYTGSELGTETETETETEPEPGTEDEGGFHHPQPVRHSLV